MMGVAGGADASFGDGLAAAARSIIADGRHALTDPELTGPEAVHEVRKALKRWRALLRLLARPLGEQADQLRTEARELMRAVAGARDAQAALDALADLSQSGFALLGDVDGNNSRAVDRSAGRSGSDQLYKRFAGPDFALPRLRDAFA